MSNIKTLKKMADRPPEERRAISQRAAAASVKKRRQLKEVREYVKALLALPMADEWEASELVRAGYKEKDLTRAAGIAVAMVKRAEHGDTRAAELVLKMIGEYPSEKMELQATTKAEGIPNGITVTFVSPDPDKLREYGCTDEEIRKVLTDHDTIITPPLPAGEE